MRRKSKVRKLGKESLLKLLFSTHVKVRNRALSMILASWMPSQSQISEEDMRMLWKGFFFLFFHTDQSAIYERLADRLSNMILELPIPIALDFFSVFLLTMHSEWRGVDFLMFDKFYLLIRKFLSGIFLLLKKNSWNLELVGKVFKIIVSRKFEGSEKIRGNGVNYHVVTVFLDEFKCFLPLRMEVLEAVFLPFVEVMGKALDMILLQKMKCFIFDGLVNAGRKLLDAHDYYAEDVDARLLGSIGVVLQFPSMFRDLAASSNCRQGNKKVIAELHESFSKLQKDFESSGVEVSFADNFINATEDGSPLLDGSGEDVIVQIDRKKSSMKKEECTMVAEEYCQTKIEELRTITNSVASNLESEFDRVANDSTVTDCVGSCCTSDVEITCNEKKRKTIDITTEESQIESNGAVSPCNSSGRSSKRVRFSMKNNIVWNSRNPLPSQELRLPPSATPRGSALKKGVPPGPIRELPPATVISTESGKLLKKNRRGLLVVTPAMKRILKLRSLAS